MLWKADSSCTAHTPKKFIVWSESWTITQAVTSTCHTFPCAVKGESSQASHLTMELIKDLKDLKITGFVLYHQYLCCHERHFFLFDWRSICCMWSLGLYILGCFFICMVLSFVRDINTKLPPSQLEQLRQSIFFVIQTSVCIPFTPFD